MYFKYKDVNPLLYHRDAYDVHCCDIDQLEYLNIKDFRNEYSVFSRYLLRLAYIQPSRVTRYTFYFRRRYDY